MSDSYEAFLTTVSHVDGSAVISKVEDAVVEYMPDASVPATEVTFRGVLSNSVEGEDLSAAVAQALAQAYGRPALEVNLVEDLTLGHAEGAHIRVTTKAGIHEGHLSGMRVRHGMDASGVRVRKITDEFVLTIGGADITVEGADKAEVIA